MAPADAAWAATFGAATMGCAAAAAEPEVFSFVRGVGPSVCFCFEGASALRRLHLKRRRRLRRRGLRHVLALLRDELLDRRTYTTKRIIPWAITSKEPPKIVDIHCKK